MLREFYILILYSSPVQIFMFIFFFISFQNKGERPMKIYCHTTDSYPLFLSGFRVSAFNKPALFLWESSQYFKYLTTYSFQIFSAFLPIKIWIPGMVERNWFLVWTFSSYSLNAQPTVQWCYVLLQQPEWKEEEFCTTPGLLFLVLPPRRPH